MPSGSDKKKIQTKRIKTRREHGIPWRCCRCPLKTISKCARVGKCVCVCVLGQRGWTCRWGQDFFFLIFPLIFQFLFKCSFQFDSQYKDEGQPYQSVHVQPGTPTCEQQNVASGLTYPKLNSYINNNYINSSKTIACC